MFFNNFGSTNALTQGRQKEDALLPEAGDFIAGHITRWSGAIDDVRCIKILQALFASSALNPRFALSGRTIGRLTGLHHQIIRRLIRGDKHCRAKLIGLVAWMEGKGRRGTRFWLTPEGRKVAELIANNFQVGKATLTALATDRWRRKMAHLSEMAHKNGTPSLNTMPSKDGFNNVCRLTPVTNSKPLGLRPANKLAERLHRDYGVRLWVANDLAARYSPLEIEAAIALRERRNGAIYNEAGFIVYLLREGYAQRYAQARLQARQRPHKPPDEPDLETIVENLQKALVPYGIKVDDEGFAELPKGRLCLPPDPDEAVDLLKRHGFLQDGNSQSANQVANLPDEREDVGDGFKAADDLHDDPIDATEPTDGAADQDLMDADLPDDSDENDEGEPLPPPACELCGCKEGEPHPALQKWQRNNLLCLSELSDDFKRRFGLPEAGLLCRGCYMALCWTLMLSENNG